MAKKNIQIEEDLHSEVVEFCKLNGVKVGDFCSDAIRNWLQLEKFGDAPFFERPVPVMVKKAEGNTPPPVEPIDVPNETIEKEGLVDKDKTPSFAEVVSGIQKVDITMTALPSKEGDELLTKLLSENENPKPRKRRL